MIAGLHFILYLLTELYRRVITNRHPRRAVNGIGAGQDYKEVNREVFDDEDENDPLFERRQKTKVGRVHPSMVNVTGFGQCIAVLTSGGDAQGW